jgi:hypothetical protein
MAERSCRRSCTGRRTTPNRSGRDYVGCLRLALEEGVALPRRAMELAGDEELAEFLEDWAEAHPGQVVEHGCRLNAVPC